MRYLDTSLLIPLYVEETRTSDAQSWMAGLAFEPLSISHWCVVEFHSALGIKSRRGELNEVNRIIVETAFQRFLVTRSGWVDVRQEDFERAAEMCKHWSLSLRAGDALHLAIAERCGLTVCTLDRVMWTAARSLGIPFETF